MTGLRTWIVGGATLAALLATAPAALADGSVTRGGGHITYQAAPGDSDAFRLTSFYSPAWTYRIATLAPIPGHVAIGSADASCVVSANALCIVGSDDLIANLGDGDDLVELGDRTASQVGPPLPLAPQVTIHGGPGTDTVHYLEPVTASLDGVANDGPAGYANDNVGSDVEVLEGSDGNDRLEGGPGPNTIRGNAGDDEIITVDGAPDVVDCGPGSDLAVVDAVDTTTNCETVGESGRMPATPPAAPPAPAAPASAPARILSGLDDKWSVHSRYTKVARLVVEDVPAGAQVSVACKGHGCPLKAKRVAVTGGKASLTRLFGSHRLKPGATIAIRVDAPSMTGRSVRFTIRAHRLPAKVVS